MGGLVFFWILEGFVPLVHFSYSKMRHACPNLFLTFTTLLVNLSFAYVLVRSSEYVSQNRLGLLNALPMPLWLYTLLGLMIIDLVSSWLIHWIQHRIRWMWRFHVIHHCDSYVDTTTANRHHPIESVFRAFFTVLAVVITGAPVWLLVLYQFLSVLVSQFSHANISLPGRLDDAISWIIVSPNMHKVHHHYMQPLTDTNYGNIFSCWDRLFGTYARISDLNTLKYGIDIYADTDERKKWPALNLLIMPFGVLSGKGRR
jgi:sterol desaturase/sphingolipid hydroxylase (fatty acid hydroxylase superfamily)